MLLTYSFHFVVLVVQLHYLLRAVGILLLEEVEALDHQLVRVYLQLL